MKLYLYISTFVRPIRLPQSSSGSPIIPAIGDLVHLDHEGKLYEGVVFKREWFFPDFSKEGIVEELEVHIYARKEEP